MNAGVDEILAALKKRVGKRKVETSKWFAWWAAGIITAALSFLAVCGLLGVELPQEVYDVTRAVITGAFAVIMGYMGKSGFEKYSRNKNGLDADGNPVIRGSYGAAQDNSEGVNDV